MVGGRAGSGRAGRDNGGPTASRGSRAMIGGAEMMPGHPGAAGAGQGSLDEPIIDGEDPHGELPQLYSIILFH